MPPPGATSTAAPGIPSWPTGATAWPPGSSPRPAPSGASTCWRCRPTRCSTGCGPTVAATPRTTRRRPATRTAPRSSRASGSRRSAFEPARHRAAGHRPHGLALWAPGRDFPSRILDAADRAAAAGEPLRAVADEWGSPTYVDDLAEAIVGLLAEDAVAGIHHLVNGGVASRADWARDVLDRAGVAVAVEEVPSSDLGATVHAAAMGRARADCPAIRRAAARLAGCDGRLRPASPAGREGAGVSPDRAASSISGVRFGAVDRHVDSRGSFRELWRAGTGSPYVQANLSSSAAGVLRGLHLHRRQVDYWVVASGQGLPRPRRRAADARRDRQVARCRDARAGRRRLGGDPRGRRPRLPGARATRPALPRDQRLRRQRRARFRLGRPGSPRCPGRSRRRPDRAARPSPSATRRTPP